MLKIKRDDFVELDEDGKFTLDSVNDLFLKISQNYTDKLDDEENEDGREED